MPLPEVRVTKLQITDFQGIDIERGVLVRAESSFAELENFDLVKPGVIRKILGTKRLTVDPLVNDQIVAIRDYQGIPGGLERIVVVSAAGKLYMSGIVDDPIVLTEIGDLYTPNVFMDEAPYIVSLPFMFEGEKRQYIVVTVGNKGFPQKWDGVFTFQANITRLGIPNPGDSFTEPYEHSLAAPQLVYTHASLGEIYLYTSPNSEQGIPIGSGRQYRAAWYNEITGHRSSLFPLHLGTFATSFLRSTTQLDGANKPLGTVQTTTGASFVMAIPLFFDNGALHLPIEDIEPPQPGYEQVQIFATKDGGSDFYLVPRLYDENGAVITDENGAISINGIYPLKYGFGLFGTVLKSEHTPIYDGFIPMIMTAADGGSSWDQATLFDDVLGYTVNGGGQGGSVLNVTRDSGLAIGRSFFTIEDDSTLYRIVSVSGAGPNYAWTIEPDLQTSPADDAPIVFVNVKPVLDIELIDSFNDSGELPPDRVNDPPPMASWGAVYQNRLFLLDAEDKTRVVYSRIGDYESFPPNNVFRFTQADFDPITALIAGRQVGLVSEGADQRLVIAKQQSTYQVTGTSILDFALTGLFPETGIIHKRAAIVVGGYMLVLSRQGLEIIEGQRPIFIGTKIKDLIDRVKLEEYGPCFAIDRDTNQLLLGVDLITNFPTPPGASITKIITVREPRATETGLASPFATIDILPTFLSVIQESGFGKDVRMLMAGFDGHIYQLFTGGTWIDLDGDIAPVVATAITQELPQTDREERKLYRRVMFEGNNVGEVSTSATSGWRISFSVDKGLTYTTEKQMYDENLIGLVGKTIIIKIRHVTEVFNPPPQLSNMMLEYSVIGEAR